MEAGPPTQTALALRERERQLQEEVGEGDFHSWYKESEDDTSFRSYQSAPLSSQQEEFLSDHLHAPLFQGSRNSELQAVFPNSCGDYSAREVSTGDGPLEVDSTAARRSGLETEALLHQYLSMGPVVYAANGYVVSAMATPNNISNNPTPHREVATPESSSLSA